MRALGCDTAPRQFYSAWGPFRWPRRWRLAFLVMVAGTMAVIAPGTASACDCAGISLRANLAAADVAFTGTPMFDEMPKPIDGVQNSAAPLRWSFDVDAVHKGLVTRTVDVLSALDGASCGIDLAAGQRYLVLGRRIDGAIRSNLCGGTVRLDQVPAEDRTALGIGASPRAITHSPRPADNAADASKNAYSGSAAVAVVALGLGSIVVVRRRQSRREVSG